MVASGGLGRGLEARGKARHDFLARAGRVAGALYAGGDRRYKAVAALSSGGAAKAAVRAKLPSGGLPLLPGLHSLAAAYRGGGGPGAHPAAAPAGLSLRAKARLGDGTKLEATYSVGRAELAVAAAYRAAPGSVHSGGWRATGVKVDGLVPLGKAAPPPRVALALTWDL